MTNYKIDLFVFCMLLMMIITPALADDDGMTLDGMTGGMTTDAQAFLMELMFWMVLIGLVVCVLIAVYGVFTASPTYTKFGLKGLFTIVGVVILYYAANFAIEYVQGKYGA